MDRRGTAGPAGHGGRVTPRECQVLRWVAAGKSDWAIAQILGISRKTVNFHVENAKRKLGACTRVQAVLVAARTGLMDEGPVSTRDFDWPFG